MAALARLIASGCYTGYAPRAPGTAGSLAALVLGGVVLRADGLHSGGLTLLIAAILAVALGTWAIAAARAGGDPGWVVIDEVAGQWIAMLPLARPGWTWANGWPGLLVACAMFRALDIAKPGPVGWADRHRGAVWVMADDVIAGLLAAALLRLAQALAPGLLDG